MKEILCNSVYFGVLISIVTYELGVLLRRKTKLAICNPLLIAVILVMIVLAVFDIDYEIYKKSADLLSYLLTPTTVCLAIPLYEKLSLLKKNAPAIMAGITAGVLSAMFSILGMALLFGLSHEEYVTLLPKSITTAIALGLAEELGGISTITVAAIMITGIFGNVIGEYALRLFRIQEPIARGIALGTSAHAIGTTRAMELGEVEGAMSSLSIAVAGLLTVAVASVFAQFL